MRPSEELTQSLIRLVDENGMDWMYSNCSVTAQHGALKWRPIFRKANLPVFEKLYKSVKTGQETREVIRDCGGRDYQKFLCKETCRNPRFRNVAGGRGRPVAAAKGKSQGNNQGHQRGRRTGKELRKEGYGFEVIKVMG